jgi:choloylglycine hydrolase
MKNLRISLILPLLFFILSMNNAYSCTDFRLTAKDGTILITRSMEFSVDFNSNLRSSPRGRTFNTTALDGNPALTWKSKYGYLYLDGMNIDAAIDGMNEQGLTIEALYLPNFAQYQTIPSGQDRNALPYPYFGDWILGNFKTVDEVRQAITKIYVFPSKVPGMGDMIFPLHFSIYDSTGNGLIVEYVGGKLNLYDNKIGILTNSPTYDWHLNNLNNYVHLTPTNPQPVVDNGVKFAATGQGFGMIGLPGDISPPSRFVKTTALTKVVVQPDDAKTALNLAEHIINNVDIPRGLAREPNNGKYINETTQWVVFKDATHKVFYYRTYNDLSLRSVDMSKVDLSENASRLKMPIASQGYVKDLTNQFVNSKV